MKKILIIIAGLIVLGGIAGFFVYKYVYNKPHPDYVKAEVDLTVRGKRLWTDYWMNKEVADKNYTGKVLVVEGTIMRIDNEAGMVIVVFAYRNAEFGDEGIRVSMLPEYQEAAMRINPFKPVKIKGLCTGYNGVDVIMENGSIVGTQE